MLAVNVADFVADIEVDGTRLILQGIHHIGKQYNEVTAQKTGGQRIEKVGAQNVGFRNFLLADTLAATYQSLVQIRILLFGDLDAIPLEMGDEPRMRDDDEYQHQIGRAHV